MRLKDFRAAGIAAETVSRLVEERRIVRAARGLYRLPDAGVDARHTLAVAAALMPKTVVCLTSALQFHDLTDQLDPAIWLAIPQGGWVSKQTAVRVRFVKVAPSDLADGVRRHVIDGVSVAVTEPARTIVDCFRFRRHVGLAVALEGLRTGLAQRRVKAADLEAIARQRRIWTVLEPYLTALVADGR